MDQYQSNATNLNLVTEESYKTIDDQKAKVCSAAGFIDLKKSIFESTIQMQQRRKQDTVKINQINLSIHSPPQNPNATKGFVGSFNQIKSNNNKIVTKNSQGSLHNVTKIIGPTALGQDLIGVNITNTNRKPTPAKFRDSECPHFGKRTSSTSQPTRRAQVHTLD